jgi:hypothetical protein
VLTEEDRGWLKALNAELWPPKDTVPSMVREMDEAFGNPAKPRPAGPRLFVFREELGRIFQLVEGAPLVTEPFCSNMFGGIGVHLYEHEQYIGTGLEHILSIAEKQLPDLDVRTVYEHILGAHPKVRPKSIGGCRDDAWEFFTKYAFAPKNLEWLKQYKIKALMNRVDFEY